MRCITRFLRILMKIIFIVSALRCVGSTINQVRELIETPDGLVSRSREFENCSIVINSEISHRYISPFFSSLRSISSNQLLHIFPIGPESEYASLANSTMILPPSEAYGFFRMIDNPIDPATLCQEGIISMADMISGPSVGFIAGVGLIPNLHDTDQSWAISEEDDSAAHEQVYLFELSTVDSFDYVPEWIVGRLLAEIARLGVDTADDENINQLPSIQYTIYRSSESHEVVARIISEPGDYLSFTPDGRRLMVRPESLFQRPKLGINTLKHIGVLIDYQHNQIGFCEPL